MSVRYTSGGQLFFAVLFLFLNSLAFGQEKRNIRVLDGKTKDGIDAVVVKMMDKDDNLIGYTITKNGGEATIELKKGVENIEFSILGYQKKVIKVEQLHKDFTVVELTEKVETLAEVVIKMEPIKQKSDTIVYNVKSFKGKDDKYIEDVIKKLPGIKVSEDGKITYRDEPISQFFIEGEDMLGGRYNQASRNINADNVEQVHIMENHQHIKVLKDKIFTDKAALNIKLKDNAKNLPFGEASVGAGVGKSLWQGKLFLMQVNKEMQILTDIKGNNTGDDLSGENKELINYQVWDLYETEPFEVLQKSGVHAPVAKDKYLDNKSLSTGVNSLFKTGKDKTLRINLFGYWDKTMQMGRYINQYGGLNFVYIDQERSFENKVGSYGLDMKYEVNNEKKYFVNRFKGIYSKDVNIGKIRENDRYYFQKMNEKPTSVENTTSYSFNVSKKIYTLKSFFRYVDRNEDFKSVESVLGRSSEEDLCVKSLLGKLMLVSTLPLFDEFIHLKTIGIYKENTYGREEGKSELKKIGGYFEPSYFIKNNNGNMQISTKVGFIEEKLTPFAVEDDRKKYFLFDPSMYFTYNFNGKCSIGGGSYYERSSEEQNFYFGSPIKLNYRSIYESSNKIWLKSMWGNNLKFTYKDFVNMFVLNVRGNYFKEWREYIIGNDYLEVMSGSRYIENKNVSDGYTLQTSIDKTYADVGINVSLSSSFGVNNYKLMQNSEKFDNKNTNWNYNIGFRFDKLKYLKFYYDFYGMVSWNKNKYNDNPKGLNGYFNKIKANFVSGNWTAGFLLNMATNEIEDDRFKNMMFSDIEVKWRKDKKIEVYFKALNIFNNNVYEVLQVDGVNKNSFSVPLRGREFLLGCSFPIVVH